MKDKKIVSDWIRVAEFVKRYPNFGPLYSMRHLISKHRDAPFLSYKGPKCTRISPIKFFEWFQERDDDK